MIRWNNDYNLSAMPEILDTLSADAKKSYGGYGLDDWCEKAAALIKDRIQAPHADVHFLLGGTQTNYTVISATLRPYQGVMCADTGHIHVHETGAVEHTGHKIHALPGKDGKLTAEAVRTEAELYRSSGVQEHITEPKMVFLSFPTELGTLYSRLELAAIREVCDTYGLYLYIDGARLTYGLGSPDCDVTIQDIAGLADAFYIGGTKCGALMGEALVLLNDAFKDHFRSHIKQNGGMLAKGWLLGLQFYTLFQKDLYFEIGKEAGKYAMQIRDAFIQKGIPFFMDSPTNQQFPILTNKQMDTIGQKHIYEYQQQVSDDSHCVRFCTSWGTKKEDVLALIKDIESLP